MKIKYCGVSIQRGAGLRIVMLLVALGSAGVALAQAQDLPNRKDPFYAITTSGQPSAEQLAALAKAGYKSVIDLRTAAEDRGMDEEKTVEGLGMTYKNLPVAGASGVTYANASAFDKLLAGVPRPVLVHCGSGNRVGALFALRARLNGVVDENSAVELGTAAGLTGLKSTVEDKLKAGHD